ncbi:MAG TPA: hypothetical protein VFV52_13385 [Bacilli bacterium]|nr:hypothetical protein [Bacilli bacterium]
MKFVLTLEESPREHDKSVEERGVTFVLDPFAISFIEKIHVDYDDFDEGFKVTDLQGPNSTC